MLELVKAQFKYMNLTFQAAKRTTAAAFLTEIHEMGPTLSVNDGDDNNDCFDEISEWNEHLIEIENESAATHSMDKKYWRLVLGIYMSVTSFVSLEPKTVRVPL